MSKQHFRKLVLQKDCLNEINTLGKYGDILKVFTTQKIVCEMQIIFRVTQDIRLQNESDFKYFLSNLTMLSAINKNVVLSTPFNTFYHLQFSIFFPKNSAKNVNKVSMQTWS